MGTDNNTNLRGINEPIISNAWNNTQHVVSIQKKKKTPKIPQMLAIIIKQLISIQKGLTEVSNWKGELQDLF